MRVFHELEPVYKEGNALLISAGVMEDLDINARSSDALKTRRGQPRTAQTPEEWAFTPQDQAAATPAQARPVFSIVQRLMQQNSQPPSAEGAGPGMNSQGTGQGGAQGPLQGPQAGPGQGNR